MSNNTAELPLLDCEDIVLRLRAQVPALRHVEAVADLATAQDVLSVAPSAWVIPASMAAQTTPQDAQVVSQVVEVSWAVALAIPMRPHELGEGGSRELLTLQLQTISALLGWYPTRADSGAWYVRGDITGYDADLLWWEDVYSTQISIHESRN